MNEINAPLLRAGRDAVNRMAIADCDLHPTPNSVADLQPYLDPRWWRHLQTFGAMRRHDPGINYARRAVAQIGPVLSVTGWYRVHAKLRAEAGVDIFSAAITRILPYRGES